MSVLYPLCGVQQKDSRHPQHGKDLTVMPAPLRESPREWHLISRFHTGDEFDFLMHLALLTLMHSREHSSRKLHMKGIVAAKGEAPSVKCRLGHYVHMSQN